jgi:putative membrane protein
MATLSTSFAAAFALLAVSLCGVHPASAQKEDTQAFLADANASSTFEIQSSQLAEQRSTRDDVRMFAEEMIRDHTAAADEMATAEKAAGLPATPPALDQRGQAMLAQLQGANGPDFDRLYVHLQQQAHMVAIPLFRTYFEYGDNPAIVGFARETLGTLEKHASHIVRIPE